MFIHDMKKESGIFLLIYLSKLPITTIVLLITWLKEQIVKMLIDHNSTIVWSCLERSSFIISILAYKGARSDKGEISENRRFENR